jgi:hypothetical protein
MMAMLLSLLATGGGRAEANPLVFACDGTITNSMITDAKPETANNVGVLVDPNNHTVSFNGYTVPIDRVDATTVAFAGDTYSVYRGFKSPMSVSGTIDRITGAMQVTTMLLGIADKKIISSENWDLLCKPKNRMF